MTAFDNLSLLHLQIKEDEDDMDDLICPVCIKMFSNEKNKEMHLKTKKHKQKLAEYLAEEALLSGDIEELSELGDDFVKE